MLDYVFNFFHDYALNIRLLWLIKTFFVLFVTLYEQANISVS